MMGNAENINSHVRQIQTKKAWELEMVLQHDEGKTQPKMKPQKRNKDQNMRKKSALKRIEQMQISSSSGFVHFGLGTPPPVVEVG